MALNEKVLPILGKKISERAFQRSYSIVFSSWNKVGVIKTKSYNKRWRIHGKWVEEETYVVLTDSIQ
jgi:aconitase A